MPTSETQGISAVAGFCQKRKLPCSLERALGVGQKRREENIITVVQLPVK